MQSTKPILADSSGPKSSQPARLTSVEIEGFKSIKELDLELKPLNILVGANNAGKSNFVSFFKLLNEMVGHRLQEFIGVSGGAGSLLYYGQKTTPQMWARLHFKTEKGNDTYTVRLAHAASDTLIFTEELLEYQSKGYVGAPRQKQLGAGHSETKVISESKDSPMARAFRYLITNCRVFHFHDTSASSRVRQTCYIEDNRFLMPDAGNLAAVLYRLKEKEPATYKRIVGTIKQIAPIFDDFVLAPSALNHQRILLNWRDRFSDVLFGPHMISDGTLRAMALITLFSQGQQNMPPVIVIDEPELGLHPFAINVLAGLLRKASHKCQIIVATQSASLLDHFEPDELVVVERTGQESSFVRLDPARLEEWLSEYTMRELWEKNVIGGGPA